MAEQLSLSDLHDRLDDLWTTYLGYLDAYTSAQRLLQKHMTSGYLSLARANFNARDGVTRYGKDFYHQRAVANKRAAISSVAEHQKAEVNVVAWEEQNDGLKDALNEETDPSASKDGDIVPKQQPSPPSTPEPTTQGTNNSDPMDSNTAANKSESKSATGAKGPLVSDPLRWFGVLVPRELRSAQTSFIHAVDDAVADAVNAAKRMREVEADVRKLRKEIRRMEKV